MSRIIFALILIYTTSSICIFHNVKEILDEFSEKNEPFDGHLYGKFSSEKGPLNQKLLSENKQLEFLGTFNGKSFYIERTLATQATARANCQALGLKLAKFDTQEELNFISATTSASDDYSWTDGRNFRNLQAFVWDQECSNGNCSPMTSDQFESSYADGLGLVISRYQLPSPTVLLAHNNTKQHYFICYI